MRLGATAVDGRTVFLVWASRCTGVTLEVEDGPNQAMQPLDGGYFTAAVDGIGPGARYWYRLDGGLRRPDPASRSQPDGVHGPSEVVDPRFEWRATAWRGIPMRHYVIYELHVGTFTEIGSFDAAVDRLDGLVELGVTAVELMPVAEFPGERNWGYDGVLPFAAHHGYGGPDGFRRFVDACHLRGLAVVLDVVYNHFGPEGAYQSDFADYFTDRYATPWGPAMNFDGPGSDQVRRYFIENALWWVDDCRVDALRLDAVHAIFDQSAHPFLREFRDAVHLHAEQRNRRIQVIAESDLNDPRLVQEPPVGGFGLDAQWSDDFHHAVHAVLTGERDGYYADFGRLADVATSLRQGYVFVGQHSGYRGRRHGARPVGVAGQRFVVCTQNHDQVGNRMNGERLTALVPLPALKVAAAVLLLAPFVPLLFMGEEYGERAPFLYFVSHTDPELVAAVRRGRKQEFAAFAWAGEPPDPQSVASFRTSRLNHALKRRAPHAQLLAWYRALLALRREIPALASLDRERVDTYVDETQGLLAWRRWTDPVAGDPGSQVLVAVTVAATAATATPTLPVGPWHKRLDSNEPRFLGNGPETGGAPATLAVEGRVALPLEPRAAVVYVQG